MDIKVTVVNVETEIAAQNILWFIHKTLRPLVREAYLDKPTLELAKELVQGALYELEFVEDFTVLEDPVEPFHLNIRFKVYGQKDYFSWVLALNGRGNHEHQVLQSV